MMIRVIVCDGCGKIPGHSLPSDVEMFVYNCGHSFCARHQVEKNQRGEIICARCRLTVYLRSIE